ncbi:hypothetical protein [Arthrobacter sp. NPDC057013]|uniref:hypothetical protein n=1 Tax=Arthrobacter sp. NPDC057013 TaxID=3345999 RepID=UPI0036438344
MPEFRIHSGRGIMSRKGDNRTIVTDPGAGMFAVVKGDDLTHKDAHLAAARYTGWLLTRWFSAHWSPPATVPI